MAADWCSAVERDTLIKTYVDVQPRISDRKSPSAYLALNTPDKSAPAPFFINRHSADTEQKVSTQAAPLPVLEPSERPVVVRPVSRPPVIRPVKPEETVNENTVTASVDDLMETGLSLLDTSEEKIVASELLLQEEIPVFQELPPQKEKAPEATKVSEKAVKPLPVTGSAPKTVRKKKDNNDTRWVDVAELRRQLSASTAPLSPEQEEIRRQNTALLEMNEAKQVAALDTKIESDIKEPPVADNKKADLPAVSENGGQKNEPKDALTKSDNPPVIVQEKTSQTADASPAPVQTAVVQDIPFAGTDQTSDTAQKTQTSEPTKKNRTALAGNSPDLWKIAEVKGNSKKNPATPKNDKTENKPSAEENSAPETAQNSAKRDMIYRNGRPVAVVPAPEKKSLNWLDRQEAAVWTSMSQSDTPSVWSSAAETKPDSSDRAKAFRVADEQPEPKAEDNVINSAPTRIVGEDPKPEAIENPHLLPLGTPAPSSPATAKTPAATGTLPNIGSKASAVSGAETAATEKTPQAEDDGLMNKIFSFFGKTDSDELPTIGSGNPTETDQKKETTKTVSKATPGKGENLAKKLPVNTKATTGNKAIVPTELRLTFKPNSAEISSQSIKWIKAFGLKAKKDIQNAVEVRMSNIEPALQNKRFAIIRNALIGTGLEEVQIMPVMTDRTPHTIVLRMIVLPEEGYTEYTTENGGIKERLYYKQW